MKFTFGFCMVLLCFVAAAFDFAYSAPPKKYNFTPAKCVVHQTDKLDGPLMICTFPPKYAQIPQADIDAAIKHIQTLHLE